MKQTQLPAQLVALQQTPGFSGVRYDYKTAQRIAAIGAAKMKAQGYDLQLGKGRNVFFVLKPLTDDFPDGLRDFYTVMPTLPAAAGSRCDCEFYKQNAAHDVCKHVYFARRELDEAARDAAQVKLWNEEQENYDLRRDDVIEAGLR